MCIRDRTYQVIQPRLPDAPQVADLGFMSENTDEEGEEEALPNPAQWLAMLGEDDEGSPREEES